jgi:hypothetical protein
MKPEEEEVPDHTEIPDLDPADIPDHVWEKVREAVHYRGALATVWRREPWFNFDWMADEIAERLGVSRGIAEGTLRELCATGEVRSMKCNGQVEEPEEAEIIRPSEWLKDQVDLTVSEPIWVFVSAADIQYWLVEEQDQEPAKPRQKPARSREIARQAVDMIWNGDPPPTVSNAQVEQQVGRWLKQLGRSDISSDTILRAAGRKK